MHCLVEFCLNLNIVLVKLFFQLYSYPHNFEMPCGSPIQPSLPIPRLQYFNRIDNSNNSITIKEKNDTDDTRDLDELYIEARKVTPPNILKTMFHSLLKIPQNLDKIVCEMIPEDLEKILND